MNIRHWLAGVRLYIAIGIVLVTLQVWWWATATYGGGTLATIRLQEVYAWISVALLAAAISIGPAYKIWPNLSGRGLFFDARRLFGIGAFWFGLLHAAITYAALFEFPNPATLAGIYQRSFLLGAVALVILLLMAFTSFDQAFRKMGTWWFRLHRLVYVAALAAIMHAFMIGSHAAEPVFLFAVGFVMAALMGMHIFIFFKSGAKPGLRVVVLTYATLLVLAVLNYGVSQYLGYNLILGGPQESAHGQHE